MARRAKEKGRISDELLDELLAGEDPAEAFRNGELPSEMKKAVAERALNAEMDHHLSREPESGSHRNGHNRKRVAMESGSMDLAVPRDRRGASSRRWRRSTFGGCRASTTRRSSASSEASSSALGMNISTGPVVPFRAAKHIASTGSVPDMHAPLLWMNHVRPLCATWPLARHKPEYIERDHAASRSGIPRRAPGAASARPGSADASFWNAKVPFSSGRVPIPDRFPTGRREARHRGSKGSPLARSERSERSN